MQLGNSLTHDGTHVVRGALASNDDGTILGGSQFSVAIQIGKPIDLEWSPPGNDKLRVTRVEPGMAHINPGNNPFFTRWQGTPELLILAFDQSMIDRIGQETFGRTGTALRLVVGALDRDILNALPIWQHELDRGGPSGRLFVESMAKAALVHLFRNYADANPRPPPIRGGLGGARLRRVRHYIEAHLADDLSVRELANIAELSAHHFGLAFRQSMGQPPHRHVIARRIEHAKMLLLTTRRT